MNTSKISRFPSAIREELNRRIDDGNPCNEILPWLNNLSDVRRILGKQFESKPVSKQNLTQWKQGGFREWLNGRQAEKLATKMAGEGFEMKDEFKGEAERKAFSDNVLFWFSMRYLVVAQTVIACAEENKPLKRLAVMSRICRDVARLRESNHNAERLRQREEQLEFRKFKKLGLTGGTPASAGIEEKAETRKLKVENSYPASPTDRISNSEPALSDSRMGFSVQPFPVSGQGQSRLVKVEKVGCEDYSTHEEAVQLPRQARSQVEPGNEACRGSGGRDGAQAVNPGQGQSRLVKVGPLKKTRFEDKRNAENCREKAQEAQKAVSTGSRPRACRGARRWGSSPFATSCAFLRLEPVFSPSVSGQGQSRLVNVDPLKMTRFANHRGTVREDASGPGNQNPALCVQPPEIVLESRLVVWESSIVAELLQQKARNAK